MEQLHKVFWGNCSKLSSMNPELSSADVEQSEPKRLRLDLARKSFQIIQSLYKELERVF